MNLIAEFLISQWKLVLIAALIGLLMIQTHRLSNEEAAHVADNIQYRLLTDAAKAKETASRELSTRTAKKTNDAQPKLVAKTKANAPELYRRRFGNIPGSVAGPVAGDLGSGISGMANFAPGLRHPGTANDPGTLQAAGPQITQGQPAAMDAGGTCDPRFLNEAAEAAAKLDGWERWRVGNGLKFED